MGMRKIYETKLEGQRKRKAISRKDALMIAYINKKYPLVHKEAELYYAKVNHMYPGKLDLRKTHNFKTLISSPLTEIKDNMLLNVILAPPETTVEVQSLEESPETLAPSETTVEVQSLEESPETLAPSEMTVEVQSLEESPETLAPSEMTVEVQSLEESSLPPELETLDGIFKEQIPDDVIQGILNDLRSYPLIDEIMQGIEDGDDDIDKVIQEIEDDNRLEEELSTLF